MNVIVVGTGTIGKAVVEALQGKHKVFAASRSGALKADIRDKASLERLFETVKDVDAVVSCAGSGAWKPLAELTDADFEETLHYKLMGQVNLARVASRYVREGGSITLTSGVLSHEPTRGGSAISMVNAALEGFARGACIEMPRGVRINVVSPPWISETLAAMGQDPKNGIPAQACARAYVSAVEGKTTGQVLDARKF